MSGQVSFLVAASSSPPFFTPKRGRMWYVPPFRMAAPSLSVTASAPAEGRCEVKAERRKRVSKVEVVVVGIELFIILACWTSRQCIGVTKEGLFIHVDVMMANEKLI